MSRARSVVPLLLPYLLLATLLGACDRVPPAEPAASRTEAIHDCPVCAGSVGAWAITEGAGHWCGGGHSREGIGGGTQTCWDECCCEHDYCFGRGVDGYQTCHDVLGNQTTNCIHGCDKGLCDCWQMCNDVENANEVWRRSRCPDGIPPRWCHWYQMYTCDRTLECAPRRRCGGSARPPDTCCAQADATSCEAELAAGTCTSRDWGCGPLSNWDETFTRDPAYAGSAACGEPCRGDFDCTDFGCGYCSRDPSRPRVCIEPPLCGQRCYVGTEGATGCFFVVDALGNRCESCVPITPGSAVGTCQPGQRSSICQNGAACTSCTCAECPDDPGCELLRLVRSDAGVPDAGVADAGVADAGVPAAPSAELPVILVPVAGGANFRMGLADYASPIVVRFPASMERQAVDARILQVDPGAPAGPLIPLEGGLSNVGDLLARPPTSMGWHDGAAGTDSELHLAIPGSGPPPTAQWIFGSLRAATTADERFVLRLTRTADPAGPLRRADGAPIGAGPLEITFSAPEGGTPPCTPGMTCAADWRWCCALDRCVVARACSTPGAYEYGGCACCSGPNPFVPTACDFCYSADLEDVFSTNCPEG